MIDTSRELNHLERILKELSNMRNDLFIVCNSTAIAYPATSHYLSEADSLLSDTEHNVRKTIAALKHESS